MSSLYTINTPCHAPCPISGLPLLRATVQITYRRTGTHLGLEQVSSIPGVRPDDAEVWACWWLETHADEAMRNADREDAAWAAAWDAAWAALEPTRIALQRSALGLVHRMIAVSGASA